MKTIDVSGLYLEVEGHNLHGFTDDEILDSVELATEGREFTGRRGNIEQYLLVRLGLEIFGVGFKIRGDTLFVRTVLTPKMVDLNEKGGRNLPTVRPFKVV